MCRTCEAVPKLGFADQRCKKINMIWDQEFQTYCRIKKTHNAR